MLISYICNVYSAGSLGEKTCELWQVQMHIFWVKFREFWGQPINPSVSPTPEIWTIQPLRPNVTSFGVGHTIRLIMCKAWMKIIRHHQSAGRTLTPLEWNLAQCQYKGKWLWAILILVMGPTCWFYRVGLGILRGLNVKDPNSNSQFLVDVIYSFMKT